MLSRQFRDANDQNQMFSVCFPPGSSHMQAVSLAGKMGNVGKAGIAGWKGQVPHLGMPGEPQASQKLVL